MVASMECLGRKLKDLCLANRTGVSKGLEDGYFSAGMSKGKPKGQDLELQKADCRAPCPRGSQAKGTRLGITEGWLSEGGAKVI
jgi:hypothetical protein